MPIETSTDSGLESTAHAHQMVSSDISSSSTGSSQSSNANSLRCQYFLSNARKWWKVDLLLNSLSALNAPVDVQCVSSAVDRQPVTYVAKENRIEIAAGEFYSPFTFRRALTRGLVYAFDNARANVDYRNIDHLVCTSVRGINMSGECDLWTKWTDYIGQDPLGMEMYSMKQRCVRSRVEESVQHGSTVRQSGDVKDAIDRVWERCFRDHWPFTTEPHMDTRFRDSPYVRPM